jgi:sigma-E factor negative regulatory protein RseA
MNEMLDSQLSAMFDDELPAAECELLARRLSRDEALQGRWRHYAVIGAALRRESNVALDMDLAVRVRSAIAAEPALSGTQVEHNRTRGVAARRAWQALGGIAVAAGVAAMSIFWLRSQTLVETPPVVAQATPVSATPMDNALNEADTYVVPATADSRPIVPSAELANYVVAHSEYSAPITRRNLLSALVASESGTATPPASEPNEQAFETTASPNVQDTP